MKYLTVSELLVELSKIASKGEGDVPTNINNVTRCSRFHEPKVDYRLSCEPEYASYLRKQDRDGVVDSEPVLQHHEH